MPARDAAPCPECGSVGECAPDCPADGWSDGGDWNRPSRGGRRTDQPQERKQRWKKILNAPLEITLKELIAA